MYSLILQGFIQWEPGIPPLGYLEIEYGYDCGAFSISYLTSHVT